jgi:FMN-dependent NADH-azoreductase
MDHQESYLLAVLGFIGLKEVRFVRAEGLSMTGLRDASVENAKAQAAHVAIDFVS